MSCAFEAADRQHRSSALNHHPTANPALGAPRLLAFPHHHQPDLGGDPPWPTRLRGLLTSSPSPTIANPTSGVIYLGQPDFGGLALAATSPTSRPPAPHPTLSTRLRRLHASSPSPTIADLGGNPPRPTRLRGPRLAETPSILKTIIPPSSTRPRGRPISVTLGASHQLVRPQDYHLQLRLQPPHIQASPPHPIHIQTLPSRR